MKNYRVAVIGALGLVGLETIRILEQRKFPMESLKLLAINGAGKKISLNQKSYDIKELTADNLLGTEIAIFADSRDSSNRFAHLVVKNNTTVIDTSNTFRSDSDVPLVIPEVNGNDLQKHHGIIASPNCLSTMLAMVIYPLHRVNPVIKVIVDTYQSVSGRGRAAIEELTMQSRQALEARSTVPHVFPHQIAFNVLPHIDVFMENGYTREESSMMSETRKILQSPEMEISATCVRVPVYNGCCEAVHVEFARDIEITEALRVLSLAPGIRVQNDPTINLYPHPKSATGSDDIFVGRLRGDMTNKRSISLWIVGDNLRKGTALNAVQIAEEIIKRDWVKPIQ